MPEEYTLDIDLNVLNHLGLNLYSNVPAVLSIAMKVGAKQRIPK